MDRSKLVAIVTGAISLLLAIAYLVLVQFLDFRGERCFRHLKISRC